MGDDRNIVWAVFGFGFGIWSFFQGFSRLRKKRLIENIPTSTVRGMAMGLVELTGKARRVKTLRGPLSGLDCVAYRYVVERYERRGKSGSWVTIAQGDSFYCPFWIDDGTGKVLVSPKEAELILKVSYEFRTGLGRNIPDNLIEFMAARNIRHKTGFFTSAPLRFKEWDIFPEQAVYVLGSAMKKDIDWAAHNERLHKRIEELKADQERMEAVDTNNDGSIDGMEWSWAISKLEQELLEEEVKSTPAQEHADVVIGKGSGEDTFIISDQSQKELTRNMNWEVIGGVFGGAVLTLVSMAYLLARLGLLG